MSLLALGVQPCQVSVALMLLLTLGVQHCQASIALMLLLALGVQHCHASSFYCVKQPGHDGTAFIRHHVVVQ